MKAYNFVLLHGNRAIFWSTVPSVFGKSSPVLTKMTKAVIKDVEEKLQVRVISVVADNENSNKGFFTALEEWRLCSCATRLRVVAANFLSWP